jgi:hypothetical protein
MAVSTVWEIQAVATSWVSRARTTPSAVAAAVMFDNCAMPVIAS